MNYDAKEFSNKLKEHNKLIETYNKCVDESVKSYSDLDEAFRVTRFDNKNGRIISVDVSEELDARIERILEEKKKASIEKAWLDWKKELSEIDNFVWKVDSEAKVNIDETVKKLGIGKPGRIEVVDYKGFSKEFDDSEFEQLNRAHEARIDFYHKEVNYMRQVILAMVLALLSYGLMAFGIFSSAWGVQCMIEGFHTLEVQFTTFMGLVQIVLGFVMIWMARNGYHSIKERK